MNEVLALFTDQLDVFAPLALCFGALLLVIDLWRSARHQRRSIMGRVFGYAPKPDQSPPQNTSKEQSETLETAFKDFEARMMIKIASLEATLETQKSDIEKMISHAVKDVSQVREDMQVLQSLALAEAGHDAQTLMDVAPLSQDEAETILSLRKRG